MALFPSLPPIQGRNADNGNRWPPAWAANNASGGNILPKSHLAKFLRWFTFHLFQPMSDVTLLFQSMERGEDKAVEELFPQVYEELRSLARVRMSRESADYTLQPTALAHEAWLRLAKSKNQGWQNRAHFIGAAAEAMRRILIERARRRIRLKHGGGKEIVDADTIDLAQATPDEKLLLINEALLKLETENEERARVVVLKYFGGMTNKEVGEALGISVRSVNRHWLCAKSWLFWELKAEM